MRVSVEEGDPGYAPYLRGGCKVFYEGYERNHVVTADEENRMAIVIALDAKGNVIVENDRIKHETIYGHIRIECSPESLALHEKWKPS